MKLVCFLATIVCLFSRISHSATTGSITLTGIVPVATSIVVTPASGFDNIDVTNGVTNLKVCDVREKNNTVNGYTVTLASSNSGKLMNGIHQIVYTAKYNNVSVTLSSTPQTITTQGAQTTIVNTLKDVTITTPATPADTMMNGNYTDSLLFTITAN